MVAGIAQSVKRLAKGWKIRDLETSRPGLEPLGYKPSYIHTQKHFVGGNDCADRYDSRPESQSSLLTATLSPTE